MLQTQRDKLLCSFTFEQQQLPLSTFNFQLAACAPASNFQPSHCKQMQPVATETHQSATCRAGQLAILERKRSVRMKIPEQATPFLETHFHCLLSFFFYNFHLSTAFFGTFYPLPSPSSLFFHHSDSFWSFYDSIWQNMIRQNFTLKIGIVNFVFCAALKPLALVRLLLILQLSSRRRLESQYK